MRSLIARHQSFPLIAFHVSAASRAVVIGCRSQADRRFIARALALLRVRFLELVSARGVRATPIVARRALHLLDQRRQARLRIAVDREVGRLVALEVLVVRADVHVLHREVHDARARTCRRSDGGGAGRRAS
jgi:hypothetical protein